MKVVGGFGSAGSSRSLRRIASAVGVGQNAAERERRATFPEPARLTEANRDEILAEAQEGYCVWCTGGPWRNIAGHWERGHGIDVHELREKLVLPKAYPFASSEFRELKRRQAIANNNIVLAQAAPRPKRHALGAYGRRQNSEKAKLVTREQRLEALSHVDRDKHAADMRRKWAAIPAEERRTRMNSLRAMSDFDINEYLKAHPEVRAKALATRKERHGY